MIPRCIDARAYRFSVFKRALLLDEFTHDEMVVSALLFSTDNLCLVTDLDLTVSCRMQTLQRRQMALDFVVKLEHAFAISTSAAYFCSNTFPPIWFFL